MKQILKVATICSLLIVCVYTLCLAGVNDGLNICDNSLVYYAEDGGKKTVVFPKDTLSNNAFPVTFNVMNQTNKTLYFVLHPCYYTDKEENNGRFWIRRTFQEQSGGGVYIKPGQMFNSDSKWPNITVAALRGYRNYNNRFGWFSFAGDNQWCEIPLYIYGRNTNAIDAWLGCETSQTVWNWDHSVKWRFTRGDVAVQVYQVIHTKSWTVINIVATDITPGWQWAKTLVSDDGAVPQASANKIDTNDTGFTVNKSE